MRPAAYAKQFQKDVKRMKKRGKAMDKMKTVIRSLIADEPLSPSYRDHKLVGNWKGRREAPYRIGLAADLQNRSGSDHL